MAAATPSSALPASLDAPLRALRALPVRASLEHNGLAFPLYVTLRTLVPRRGGPPAATIALVLHPQSRFLVATVPLLSNPLPRGAPAAAFADVLLSLANGLVRGDAAQPALGFRPSELLVDCPALADALDEALAGSRTIVRLVKGVPSTFFTGQGAGAAGTAAGVERFYDTLRVARLGGPHLVALNEVADEVARDVFSRLPLGYAADSILEVAAACANTRGCGRLMFVRAMELCGRCFSRVFCSAACQAADWPVHKARCRAHCGAAGVTREAAEADDAKAEAENRKKARNLLMLSAADAEHGKKNVAEAIAALLPLRELRRIVLDLRLCADAAAALATPREELQALIVVKGGKAARDAMDDTLVCLGMAQDKRGDGVRKY